MIETHPFGDFVPQKTRYLILGSFTGRQAVKGQEFEAAYDWFYGRKMNQFWPIIEAVYGVSLPDKASRQRFFGRLGIAVADIIYRCERKKGSNLDGNLRKGRCGRLLCIIGNLPRVCVIFEP